MVTLRSALLSIGRREKPWAAVFAALVSGEVRFHIADLPARVVDRITVESGEKLKRVLETTFDRDQHDFPFASVMRQRDAIELSNVDPKRFQHIALPLPANARRPMKTWRVDRLLDVARELIDSREARRRWARKSERSRMIRSEIGWCRATIGGEEDRRPRPVQTAFEF